MEDDITIEDFAELIGVDPKTVYRRIHSGKIPAREFKVAGRNLYSIPRKGAIEWTESQLDELDREKTKLLKVRETLIEGKLK